MKRQRRESNSILESLKAIAERQRSANELLQALTQAIAVSEKREAKFRSAAILELSRIGTTVTMIHGAQIVETHISKPGYPEKMEAHAKAAEESISQQSHERGLKIVRFIYNDEQPPERRPAKRRQWSDWEI